MWHTWGSSAYRFLFGKRKGRSRCRREHNIKTDPTEICWEPVNWINLAKARDSGVAVLKPGMYLEVFKMQRIFGVWPRNWCLLKKDSAP